VMNATTQRNVDESNTATTEKRSKIFQCRVCNNKESSACTDEMMDGAIAGDCPQYTFDGKGFESSYPPHVI